MLNFVGHYNPFDTYDAWRGKRAQQQRLLAAIIVLNVIPLVNFACIIVTLGRIDLQFQMDLAAVALVLLIPLLSMIVYGYYRLFVALLYKYPRSFYTNDKRLEYFTKLDENGKPVSFGARFWPGLLYVLIPNLLLLVATMNSPALSNGKNQTQVIGTSGSNGLGPWLVGGAVYYSDVVIAIFTAAAVLVAFFQVKHELGGPNLKLEFPTDEIPLIGPVSLSNSLMNTSSMAIFFDSPVVFRNEGPQAGVIAQMKWRLLTPEICQITRSTGEIDGLLFQFRFEGEEAAGQPLGAITVEGESATSVKATCALIKSNLQPGDSNPPTTDLATGPIILELSYIVIGKKGQTKMNAKHKYRVIPAVYNSGIVDRYKAKLFL